MNVGTLHCIVCGKTWSFEVGKEDPSANGWDIVETIYDVRRVCSAQCFDTWRDTVFKDAAE